MITDSIFLSKAAHYVIYTFYNDPSKGKKNILILTSENNDASNTNYSLIN